MSRETSLAKNTFIMSIGTILPKVSYLVTLPIVTAKLTKAEYGTYDLVTTMVSLFLPVVSLQVQAAAFRFLIDCKDDEKEKNSIITNVVTFVTVTSLIALAILYFALFRLSPTVRILICAYFFTDILLRALVQVVRGLSKPVLFSVCTSVQPIVNMLLVVAFVYFIDGGLEGALVAMTVSTVAALAIVLVKGEIFAGVDLKLLSKSTLKELIGYAWPMIPNSLSLWMLRYSDRLVLISYIGISANAVYSAANQIPSILSLMNSAFTQAWQENASITLKEEDAAVYYGNMFDNILRILAGILAMLIGVTPILFLFLIRGNYSESYYQMPILMMAMFFSSISSFFGGIYIAHKKTKSVGITTIIAAVLNILVDLALIKRLEIYAASISTLIAYLFLSVYRMHNVRRFQEIKYRYASICGCVAVLVGMCILLWFHNIYLNILNFLVGAIFALYVNKELIGRILEMLKGRVQKKG